MDLRKSFSKPFKKAKQKLAEVGRKRDRKPGSESNRQGREPDVEGSEASQRNSRLYLEAEDVVESGPSQEGDDVDWEKVGRVDPAVSALSIPHSGEPSSA
jgi:hypothetical protein